MVAAAVAGALALTEPAGNPAPHPMRIAVLNGVEGPVYYSVVDGGYRAVATATTRHPADDGEQIASAAE